MRFNEALEKANFAVLEKHPHLGFYEANAMLLDSDENGVDGTVSLDSFKAIYTNMENGTYVATINHSGEVNIEFIDEPWLEDIIMSPYVPMDVEFALKLLAEAGMPFDGGPLVLRHQLYPEEAEPRYFFGPAMSCNTVGVYTGKINVPLG